MRILGIDYGRKKIGLAIGDTETKLVEPLKVIRYQSKEEALEKVSRVSRVSKVVLGISEGKMAEETRMFAKELEDKLGVSIDFQDETLTTLDAQRFSIEGGIKRKKRKKMEDAYSAALILQSYLDSK